MNYTALYRKFRPNTFSEIVGQEAITQTLKNQIISNRVGHAYLFNGGRGTGKTSAAKVMARAVNCLNPQNGEPCNECEICKAAISGSLTDIVEMDAASNNSVEDIRSIRDEVNFLPTSAKYRVYIIDEVHMLSTGAFNALLKTLEEPPSHVKFILATTEPQKLPATILSRCQRFDFKRISNDNIIKRLKFVCDESKITISDEALNLIAILSEGAMRDALSILERCIQDGENNINEDKIKELVGIPKIEDIEHIMKGISDNNIENVVKITEKVISEGKDVTNLIWEIIKYTKDLLVYKTTENIQMYNENEINKIKEISSKLSVDRLMSIIYKLSELESEIKFTTQKNIMFQVGIIKLCNETSKELEQRVTDIENAIKNKTIIQPNPIQYNNRPIQPNVNRVQAKQNVAEQNRNVNSSNNIQSPVDKSDISAVWRKIVTGLKQSGKIMLYTNLVNTSAREINDLTFGIIFPNGMTPFGKTILEKRENIAELTKLVSIELGKEMQIKYISGAEEKKIENTNENSIETMANLNDLPINIIE